MRRRSWVYAVALLLSSALWVQAQQGEELEILQAANQDRARHGLAPLKWDPALAQAAQAHAELMAQQPALSHQYPGEPDLATRAGRQGAHFRIIAENIAVGPDAGGLETQWMHSPPHRANLLDPKLDSLGVGLVKRGSYYYGVQDFADAVASLGPQQVEDKVGALLKQSGIEPSGPERDARQTCEMPHGVAGGSSPKSVVRWESSDLSQLPPQLQQQIQTGQFHTAAVGACDSTHPGQGFTTYRVAVLLY